MKKFFLLIFVALMGATMVNAQTLEERKAQAKERIALRKLTRKVAESKIAKDAKERAKAMTKEGWKPMEGAFSLDHQMNELLMMQYESEGLLPKYFIGRGTATSLQLAMAQKMATSRARTEIAEQMGGEIAELIEESDNSMQLSSGETAEVMKVTSNSKQIFQQKLGRTVVVFSAYREVNGKKEVSIAVAYDGTMAKEAILAEFAKDDAALKEKLDNYLSSGK